MKNVCAITFPYKAAICSQGSRVFFGLGWIDHNLRFYSSIEYCAILQMRSMKTQVRLKVTAYILSYSSLAYLGIMARTEAQPGHFTFWSHIFLTLHIYIQFIFNNSHNICLSQNSLLGKEIFVTFP